MKKTIFLQTSPLLIVAISFCVTGIGMFGYFYYSDHQEQQITKDNDLTTKSATQKAYTTYQTSNNLIKNPLNLPLKLTVTGDVYQKTGTVSYDNVFHLSWIPLLVIGSYILVHARNGIESKASI